LRVTTFETDGVGGYAEAPLKSAASLRELAYRQIKQRIISCELRPGEAINETQLINLLGLGRTPIHQALHRLEVCRAKA
jgi:DNA-binding GntR family transcriptional regulator